MQPLHLSALVVLFILPLATTFQLSAGRRCAASGRRHAPCRLGEEVTADSMAPLWKVLKLDEGGQTLAPASGEWEMRTVQVEIPRTLESPGLGIMLEEYGAAADGAGLTLITGLADGGNAALSGVDLQPGDVGFKLLDAQSAAEPSAKKAPPLKAPSPWIITGNTFFRFSESLTRR